MTEFEYRNHPAISRSELWRILESPQKFRYFKDNPQPTPSLVFGQIFHKMALEPDAFYSEYVMSPEVDKRTKEGKQRWQGFLEQLENKTIVPKGMIEQAKSMCEAMYSVPFASKLLKGCKEVPFFWTDEVTGEACKCRADCLNTQYSTPIIVDVKSASDASTEAFSRDAIKYGYDFQAAMYTEGVSHHITQRPLFVFIVVEKEPPYAVNILQADDLFLKRGHNLFRESIEIYHDCRTTENWYGYLGKNNQINTLALPAWLAKEVT